MTNKGQLLLFLPLMCISASSLAAGDEKENPLTTTLKHEQHFPRIEIYRMKDYGSSTSGEDKLVENDGTVRQMGKRAYEPYIERTSYLLDSAARQTLLNKELVFLPYFMEMKQPVTLKYYFNMSLLQDLPQRKALFPNTLDGYTAIIEKKELQPSTLLAYNTNVPADVQIVWLDEETWFVNNVFYQLPLDDIIDATQTVITDQKLVKGELDHFIHHSYVIQSKLNEGFNYLDTNPSHYLRRKDNVVMVIGKSPGSPGTNSYEYTFYADGNISVPGLSYYVPSYKIRHYQWVDIQNKLKTIDFDLYEEESLATPLPFVHDGQTSKLYAFNNGNYYKLHYGTGSSPMPPQVSHFTQEILKLVAELDH